jgi:hypothetical protein
MNENVALLLFAVRNLSAVPVESEPGTLHEISCSSSASRAKTRIARWPASARAIAGGRRETPTPCHICRTTNEFRSRGPRLPCPVIPAALSTNSGVHGCGALEAPVGLLFAANLEEKPW